jgi:hypothetical protein
MTAGLHQARKALDGHGMPNWPQTTTKAQTFGRGWGHLGPALMLIVTAAG